MHYVQRTTVLKEADLSSSAAPRWYLIDANGMIVGRLASQIATILMGKHRPDYTHHLVCGDYVVVVNADKVKFEGGEMQHPRHPYFTTKMRKKRYIRHSTYPGGLKVISAIELWEQKPTEILWLAVKRMLPKNAMARYRLERLKLYAGPEHPHQAQGPQPFPLHLLPRRR